VGILGAAPSVAVASASVAAAAATVNVPCSPSAPGGGPAGLIAAINKANKNGGGTINLASRCAYTFGPHRHNDTSGLPVVTTPITINGNGSTVARSQAPGTENFRIFEVDGPGELTLHAITIAGGRSSGGGGILADKGARLTLVNSRVDDNTVTVPPDDKAFGGGISVDHGSTLALHNSRVDHNSVIAAFLSGGGGLYENNGSSSTVDNSRVDHNGVTASIAVGGGIALDGGSGSRTISLHSSEVADNRVDASATGSFILARGGGIENNGTMVTMTSTQVTGNAVETEGGSAFGGGIHNLTSLNQRPIPDGLLALTSSRVTGNTVTGRRAGGGGISNEAGATKVTSSQVTGNAVGGAAEGADGGGIENLLRHEKEAPLPTLTMTTSQLTDNAVAAPTAPACGGGLFNSGSARATVSAITGNRATGSPARGGGVFTANTLNVMSSVVSGNVPDNRVDGTAASCDR
jgi:hypothetical protein